MQVALKNNSTRRKRNNHRLPPEEKQFLESLISRSGMINRLIMRLYLNIDLRGLERWRAYISRLKGKKLWLNLISFWPLRILERISAVYIGGSLTAAEQQTFARICKVADYKLTRYNSLFFGSAAGFFYFYSGKFSSWLSGFGTVFDLSLDLTAFLLFSFGLASVLVDAFRALDSFFRRKAHMPFGVFPLVINSTTFLKVLFERLKNGKK